MERETKYQMWSRPLIPGGEPPPEDAYPPRTYLGEFGSISLACRRIIEIEKYTTAGIPLSVVFHTQFIDDNDAVSHYSFNSMTSRYIIRLKGPPSPKFKGSLGKPNE